MVMRFRKSFKLLPGVKVNVGKKSIGVSAGNKYGGVSVNSKTGVRGRVSAPGTGISFSETDHKAGKAKSSVRSTPDVEPCSTMFDEQVVRSLNSAAFDDYILAFGAYARTVSKDDPILPEVERQINMLAAEQARRFRAEKDAGGRLDAVFSLGFLVAGILIAAIGLGFLFVSRVMEGGILFAAGLLLLFISYFKQ